MGMKQMASVVSHGHPLLQCTVCDVSVIVRREGRWGEMWVMCDTYVHLPRSLSVCEVHMQAPKEQDGTWCSSIDVAVSTTVHST